MSSLKSIISFSQIKELDKDLMKLIEIWINSLRKICADQVDHNLDKGFLKLTGNGTFSYSYKGLFYVWLQAVKDMIRYFLN